MVMAGFALALAAWPAGARPRYSHAFEVRMGDVTGRFNSQEEKACWDLQVTTSQRECLNNKIVDWAGRLRRAYRHKLASLPPERRAVLAKEQVRWDSRAEWFCTRYRRYDRPEDEPGTLALVQVDACRFNVNYKRTHDIERFR